MNTRKLNEICWMAKFVRKTKDVISPKEQAWVKKINSSYTKDELGPDDCRK